MYTSNKDNFDVFDSYYVHKVKKSWVFQVFYFPDMYPSLSGEESVPTFI